MAPQPGSTPSRRRQRRLLRFGLLLAAAAWTAPFLQLQAQDRMFRRYAAGQGFKGAPVSALAQDARGFLWIGGQDGLYRYDGTEFRHWAVGELDASVLSIATNNPERLVVLTEPGHLYEVIGNRATRLDAPLPSGRGQVNCLAFDGHGRLWMVRGGRIAYRDSEGAWHTLPAGAFGDEPPRFLRAAPNGAIAVATWSGVWQLEAGATPVRLLESSRAPDFTFLADGGVAAIDSAIRMVRHGDRHVVDPFAGAAIRPRPIALAQRGETLWASYDRFLVAVRQGRAPEVIGADHGVESGGPLLVDHEGSLWMGTFTALLQYPEPETRIWNERAGLRSQHTRFIGASGDALWVTTWQGTVLLRSGRSGASWLDELFSQGDVCDDDAGHVWLVGRGEIVQARGDRALRRLPIDAEGTLRCARNRAGGAWLSPGDRLLHADSGRLRAAAMPSLPADLTSILSLLHDSRSGFWIGADGMICKGEVVGRDTLRGWECTRLPRAGQILAFHETASGEIWAASSRAGVLVRRGDAWVGASGNDMLPSRALLNLIPSPAGGVWILGHGVVWRVEEGERGGLWRVRERLGEWHGLPLESGRDLHEDLSGTVWITTSLGVIEVPASARRAPERPPLVALVEALVDDEAVDMRDGIVLPYRRNRLELRFALLSFRDPGRLRHQVRLTPREPWRSATGRPWLRWIDLPPRSHHAELRASLDGEHWSPQAASFSFEVRPPWYRSWWAIALATLTAAIVLRLGYRARVRYLVGLERERMRISMDLHDEMGSGLGSIGILSGLLAGVGLADGRGRELARRIANTAEELGGSLSHIIWSLDARPATLAELASRLAESGVNLLAAQGIAFRTDFPDAWPAYPLSARARRNLLLIGLEALHNVARHACAHSVTLGIRRRVGRWELRVVDDGIGFDATKQHSAGHGLVTMQRRAGEMAASIDLTTGTHRGTAVVVRFALGAPGARLSVFRTLARRTVRSARALASTSGSRRAVDEKSGGAA